MLALVTIDEFYKQERETRNGNKCALKHQQLSKNKWVSFHTATDINMQVATLDAFNCLDFRLDKTHRFPGEI